MSNIVTIGFSTEGSTDQRFLESIIRNTFEEVAFECEGLVEVYSPIYLKFQKDNGFVSGFLDLSRQAFSSGLHVLCIHADADSDRDEHVINSKFTPAFQTLEQLHGESTCKNIVCIIPVHMTEAWLLADKELLKQEIGCELSDEDLEINKSPESFANPKAAIENALRIAQDRLPKRRNRIQIRDLYQPLGQKISIAELEKLPSFLKFKTSVREAFRTLNYLQN